MSRLERDPHEKAEELGLDVVEPSENELFVDIDDEEGLQALGVGLAALQSNGIDARVVRETQSAGGNIHVYVRLPEKVSPLERVALQACLGSDRLRELLSFLRIRAGLEKPTVFFEQKTKDSPRAIALDGV